MTLDEAIKRNEDLAEYHAGPNRNDRWHYANRIIAEEHRQLAEWLKELKQLREQTRWIPVSERLPEENKTVIASTAFGVYPEAKYTKEDGWVWAYESGADYWEELDYVEAWMPLPQTYKAKSEDKE